MDATKTYVVLGVPRDLTPNFAWGMCVSENALQKKRPLSWVSKAGWGLFSRLIEKERSFQREGIWCVQILWHTIKRIHPGLRVRFECQLGFIIALWLCDFVTLGKLFNLSGTQYSHMSMLINHTSFIRVAMRIKQDNELKSLAQWQPYGNFLI